MISASLLVVHDEHFLARNAQIHGSNHDAFQRIVAHGQFALVFVAFKEDGPIGFFVHQVGAIYNRVDAPIEGNAVGLAVFLAQRRGFEGVIEQLAVGDLVEVDRLQKTGFDIIFHLVETRGDQVNGIGAASAQLGELFVIGADEGFGNVDAAVGVQKCLEIVRLGQIFPRSSRKSRLRPWRG